MSTDRESDSLVLVTGATGYIGAHLVGPLKGAGYPVRVAARSPQRLSPGVRRHADEVVAADAFDPDAVAGSLQGVHTAFYLVHTLGWGPTTLRGFNRWRDLSRLRLAPLPVSGGSSFWVASVKTSERSPSISPAATRSVGCSPRAVSTSSSCAPPS